MLKMLRAVAEGLPLLLQIGLSGLVSGVLASTTSVRTRRSLVAAASLARKITSCFVGPAGAMSAMRHVSRARAL